MLQTRRPAAAPVIQDVAAEDESPRCPFWAAGAAAPQAAIKLNIKDREEWKELQQFCASVQLTCGGQPDTLTLSPNARVWYLLKDTFI